MLGLTTEQQYHQVFCSLWNAPFLEGEAPARHCGEGKERSVCSVTLQV